MGWGTGVHGGKVVRGLGGLLLFLLLSGCASGGASPGGDNGGGNGGGNGGDSPSSSTAVIVTPSEKPAAESDGEDDNGSSSVTSSEAICSEVYANRGAPPIAQSMDLDDQMALEAKWHADLIANAGQLLAPMGGSTEELVGLMEEAWSLNLRAAQLYSEHMIISQELDAIQARLDEMQGEVQAAAEAARAPSCADLVILP